MMKRLIALAALLCASFLGSCTKSQSKQTIHVIGSRDEIGKSQYIDLLVDELSHLGHHVEYYHVDDLSERPKADVNLFVEDGNTALISKAKKNYLIPDPDTCHLSKAELKQFDKILCKSARAQEIFSQYHPQTDILGFTCKDRFDATCMKNFMLALHVAGQSSFKGTQTVAEVWSRNPQFPGLLLLKHQKHPSPPVDNITQLTRFVKDDELKLFQNGCAINLCPSETSDLHLTLLEAMSCGNVVVTLDVPPFNALVRDRRCLVKGKLLEEKGYSKRHTANLESLDLVVSNLFSLSVDELQEIAQKNREAYLANHSQFQKRLAELFS